MDRQVLPSAVAPASVYASGEDAFELKKLRKFSVEGSSAHIFFAIAILIIDFTGILFRAETSIYASGIWCGFIWGLIDGVTGIVLAKANPITLSLLNAKVAISVISFLMQLISLCLMSVGFAEWTRGTSELLLNIFDIIFQSTLFIFAICSVAYSKIWKNLFLKVSPAGIPLVENPQAMPANLPVYPANNFAYAQPPVINPGQQQGQQFSSYAAYQGQQPAAYYPVYPAAPAPVQQNVMPAGQPLTITNNSAADIAIRNLVPFGWIASLAAQNQSSSQN